MNEEPFFSNARREFIARTMMDVFKLVLVAAIVSGFFVSSALPVRIGSLVALLVGFTINVITFPKKAKGT